jgi:hypothetical protein
VTKKPVDRTANTVPDLAMLLQAARSGNAQIVKLIAKQDTPDSDRALVDLLLGDGTEEIRQAASQAIDKASKKRSSIAELVVAQCHAKPESVDEDLVLVRFAELAVNDDKLAKDPRTLALLRRHLEVKPAGTSADELLAQETAIAFLVSIEDRASVPAIVALLEQEDRNSLWFNICDAVKELGAGKAELAKLRAARERATELEQAELDDAIKKLEK